MSNVRVLAAAQEFPQTAGLAVSLLGTIADCIEPSEAEILIDPLREVAESFASSAPGSLFAEWAPPRKPSEEEVELHRAQAFAESCKDKDENPPAAALGADSESHWVSSDSADPSKWTLKLAEPMTAIHAVSIEFATTESISKPGKVTVETSSDGFKFKAVGKPITISDGDDKTKDDNDDELAGASDDPFKPQAASGSEANDALRVSIPPSRKVQFLRITMEGKAGSATSSGSCRHALARVRLLRVRSDPLRTSTAQVLSTIVRACSVAGAKDAPAPARVAAIEALLAIAAATSSTQAATLAMAITSQHLVAGGTSLPGSIAASLGAVVRAATSASIEALKLAASSGHAASIAAALETVKGLGGGEGGAVEAKFDPRNHGDSCEIRNGGRLWHSTASSDNWAMAKVGVKKPMIATWEFEVTQDERSDEQTCVGFSRKTVSNSSYQSSSDLWMIRCYNGQLYNDGSSHPSVDNIHPGDVVRFRANMKKGSVELWINGSKQNDGDPIFTGITGTIFPAVCAYSSNKETRFKSYKIEGADTGGTGVPVLSSTFPALLQAIKATKGMSAPFIGSGSSNDGIVVDGKPMRSVVVMRPDGSVDTDFGKKRDGDIEDDEDVSSEVLSTLPAVTAGQVELRFTARDAIAGLKKKPLSSAEVRSFTATFSVSPLASAATSVACSVAEVLINDRIRWRSAPLHASSELSGTPADPQTPQTCTVTAGVEDVVRVVVRKGLTMASGDPTASAAAAASGAGAGDDGSSITPVVLSSVNFGMGLAGASLKAFLPDPSEAVDAVFAGSDAAPLGSAVSPLLCQGGGFGPDGNPTATMPTAQFLAELTAALTASAQAEAAVTRAAVACVGAGGSRVTADDLEDDEKPADESGSDGLGSSGPTGLQKAALLARLLQLEAPLSLETSDAAVLALAEGLEVALGLPLPDAVRDRVALTLTAQAAVLLGRVSGSGLPARSLGLTLPSSPAKGAPVASASASASAAAMSTPLNRLRAALDGFEADKITATFPLAAASALAAADAGTGLFYPTKALRDALLSRLLAGGATMELQIRFPSLSRAVVDSTLAALPAKTRDSLTAWPAEAHPSMRDSRFDRLVSLVQAAAGAAGLRCEVRGRWGGWIHLLVALPEAGAGAVAGGVTAAAQFVSTTMAGCMKRAGMGAWRFPGGCMEPIIAVEVRRSRAVGEDDRRFSAPGQAVVRLFPAASGSFDAIVADVEEEITAFVNRLTSRAELQSSSLKAATKDAGEAEDNDESGQAGGESAASDGNDSDASEATSPTVASVATSSSH